ncbi:MAG TPA: hypothetical protein PLG67_02785 [Bacillota bacterium]|jgi:hypothetical protein|nr:hypothetical protein [Bacillota bacterium]HQI16266.1 hypothetical protein [Bacillota bacterium]HQJ36737.1 hypothetical protein [Bacillota bacterium]HQL35501.1 hypothetical protein [Bacillota bacterium]HRS20622.1 hypothetical protein [Clostridia bacterium]
MRNAIIIGNLNLNIELEFDTETKNIIIKDIKQSFNAINVEQKKETRKINESEARYFIITFGSRAAFTSSLPQGQNIIVRFEGNDYPAKVHSNVKGRLDGLGAFYRNSKLKAGDTIEANYIANERVLEIKLIG